MSNIIFLLFFIIVNVKAMNVGDELYTNTWYKFTIIKSVEDKIVEGSSIVVSKGNNWADNYKLCVGVGCNSYFLANKFRFRISGDNSVVKLNTLERVGIDYAAEGGWLSKYGDYVKTTDFWSKASWFVVHQADSGYKFDIFNQANTFLAYNKKDSENRRGNLVGYIHPYNSEVNADIFKITPYQ